MCMWIHRRLFCKKHQMANIMVVLGCASCSACSIVGGLFLHSFSISTSVTARLQCLYSKLFKLCLSCLTPVIPGHSRHRMVERPSSVGASSAARKCHAGDLVAEYRVTMKNHVNISAKHVRQVHFTTVLSQGFIPTVIFYKGSDFTFESQPYLQGHRSCAKRTLNSWSKGKGRCDCQMTRDATL